MDEEQGSEEPEALIVMSMLCLRSRYTDRSHHSCLTCNYNNTQRAGRTFTSPDGERDEDETKRERKFEEGHALCPALFAPCWVAPGVGQVSNEHWWYLVWISLSSGPFSGQVLPGL